MNNDDFLFLQKLLQEKSGLAIKEDKVYLLESRLMPLARENKFDSISAMVLAIRSGGNTKLSEQMIDAMTTNETLFFRDDKPFTYFRQKLLPDMIKARETRKSLRLWSAACSTGQEPYSVSIILKETLPDADKWLLDILATDISPSALELARRGRYTQFEIQRGMPIQMLMKYFEQDGTNWAIKEQLKKIIRFQSFNLLDSMNGIGPFDIVFCRNVLIYFDEQTKKKVLENISKRLAPDGFLFLGGSETVLGLCPDLKNFPGCSGLYTLASNPLLAQESNRPAAAQRA
jgi:chemotaxis protein methyltransferase CheR